MTRVGFIGLGAMGLPMAARLVAARMPVRGFDISQAAAARFAAAGGEAVATARDAAAGADLLVLMVVNIDQATQLLLGDGALDGLPEGAVVALMATCPPRSVERLAEQVEAAGRRFVDAPVSGGVAGARDGTLSMMVGGAAEAVARARPVLDAMGSKVFHVGGKPGAGAAAKAVNQLLCGVHLAAAAEALSFAERIGMDPAVALEIVSGSAASSWMLRDRGPRMLQDAPPVASAVDIFVKDLGIVMAAGTSAKAALPLAAAAHQMFLAASGQGRGEEDDSEVIAAYRSLAKR